MDADDVSSAADDASAARWRLREYRPADDGACRELERHASQHMFKSRLASAATSLLLKAHLFHAGAFDARAAQFPARHVLVCEDTRPAKGEGCIVGVVAVGIKPGSLRGREVLLGYMFDLRVHERVQRRGIGARLCRLAEARCAADGVDTLYLSVNATNRRARELYRKLGYSHASSRAPSMSFLFRTLPVWPSADGSAAPGVRLARLSATEAAACLRSLVGTDCSLDASGMADLAAHPNLEASWRAQSDDGSVATLHLWNSSSLGGFLVERLLVPTRWLDSALAGAVAAALLLCALVAYARVVCGMYARGHTARAAATLLGGAAMACLCAWAAPWLRFARRLLLRSRLPGSKVRDATPSRCPLRAPPPPPPRIEGEGRVGWVGTVGWQRGVAHSVEAVMRPISRAAKTAP